jgi:hypothetical protein
MRASFAALFVILLTTSAFAQSRDSETVIVGPWAIATTYKAEEFESCTMGRSAGRTWNNLCARTRWAARRAQLAKMEA